MMDYSIPPPISQTRITDYNFFRAPPQLPRPPALSGFSYVTRPGREIAAEPPRRMRSYEANTVADVPMAHTPTANPNAGQTESRSRNDSDDGPTRNPETEGVGLNSQIPILRTPPPPSGDWLELLDVETSDTEPPPIMERPIDDSDRTRPLWLSYVLSASPRPLSPPPLPSSDAPPPAVPPLRPDSPFLYAQPTSPSQDDSFEESFTIMPTPPPIRPIFGRAPLTPRMEVEISIERQVEEDSPSDGMGMDGVELDADGVPVVAEGSGSGVNANADKAEAAGSNIGGWVVSGR